MRTDAQRISVVVFLSPECPLSQNYTSVLNKLAGTYDGKVSIEGVIPDSSYSVADIEKFRKEYHIVFDLSRDPGLRRVHGLKATTTPQAFLLDEEGHVVYEGLIDNWAVSLGVQRTVITEHYLTDAIEASLHHSAVAVRKTQPVGCLINTN